MIRRRFPDGPLEEHATPEDAESTRDDPRASSPGSPEYLRPVERQLLRRMVDLRIPFPPPARSDPPAPPTGHAVSIRLGPPILEGRACPTDARLRQLQQFTEEVIRTRGHPSVASLRTFLETGFTRANVLEVMREVTLRRAASTGVTRSGADGEG